MRSYDTDSRTTRIAEYIELYRDSEVAYRAHEPGFLTAQPLRRIVTIRPSTWLARLDAAHDRTPEETRHQLGWARSFMHERFPNPGDATISRSDLVELSECLVEGTSSDQELVALWVATMAWGSGKTNGRGPWRLEQSLSAPTLVETLRTTSALVLTGQLAKAHASFDIDGIGESFFTKWFWVTSLCAPQERRALILDKRVRTTLWRTQSSPPIVPRTSADYAAFVAAAHVVGRALLPGHSDGDAAEKIEWLLFDRQPARGSSAYRDLATHLRPRP